MAVHLVIGAGEVGTAVAKALELSGCDVELRDVHTEPYPGEVDWMHVCIPWSELFDECVVGYCELHRPAETIIHSTVPVGTCRSLDVLHSPVRGRHPDLVEGLTTFVKHFGGPTERSSRAASMWSDATGSPARHSGAQEDTEAGKLWELLMFGLAIAQQKEMYRWCRERGADPDVAYRQFTETYNEGYRALGEPHVARPVIRPQGGPIGGHCVVQNAVLVDHPFADLLIELNQTW